jgi:two-component system, chemotaxis family, CheB/CheR fusion protein
MKKKKTTPDRTRQKKTPSTVKKAVKGTKKPPGPSIGKVRPDKVRSKTGAFPIVGIGASAGGLEACTQLLRHLPSDSGMAFVLVQHLDPKHKSILSDLLAKATSMPVSEVKDGMHAKPNHVYVIPPNTGMVISRAILVLTPRAETHGFHMPIDQFFHSLAEDQKNNAVGVILSGTASDGALGLKAIKTEGGITFAQDEKTAKYGGMPHSAIVHGAVDFILPPEGIAKELVRIGRHSYLSGKISIAPDNSRKAETGDLPPQDENDFSQVLTLLLSSSRVDFTYYKQATIKRRIARRMALHRLESVSDYVKYLRENPAEVEALYQDILIHVTGFFRDPEPFEALKKAIFPKILNQRSPEVPLRVWVPGCSTGEEAYSLAISLLEFLGEKSKNIPIQIFATDISETTLEKARTGRYGENIQRDVSAKRLQRFFTRVDSGYQISKSVRDLCVFAKQDLAKDPPFSNLDLISCRNVLIYMNASLQKKVMGIFHYALRPTGYLLLGKTESIVGYPGFFSPVDKRQKIYSRKMSAIHPDFGFAAGDYELKKVDVIKKMGEEGFNIEKEANRIVLSRYAPAGVIAMSIWIFFISGGARGLILSHHPERRASTSLGWRGKA